MSPDLVVLLTTAATLGAGALGWLGAAGYVYWRGLQNEQQAQEPLEDPKIGPEVAEQLEDAQKYLAEARHMSLAGSTNAALEMQLKARELATAAFIAADEQVRPRSRWRDTNDTQRIERLS